MTSTTSSANQETTKLTCKEVLVRREIPSDLLSRWGDKLQRKVP